MVVLVTGCRPKDAAYIVQHKAVRSTNRYVQHMVFNFEAFVPKEHNKTNNDYYFLLPVQYNFIVNLIEDLTSTGYPTYKKLDKSVKDFYTH